MTLGFCGPPLSRRVAGNLSATLGRHRRSPRFAAFQSTPPTEGDRGRVFRRIDRVGIGFVVDLARGNIDDQLGELVRIPRAGFS